MDRNKILAPALNLVGKGGLRVDEQIPSSYLLCICLSNAISMLRGIFRGLGFGSRAGSPIIGRGVKLRCKKKIYLGRKVRMLDGVYIDALSSEGVRLGDCCLLGRGCRIECTGSIRHIGRGIAIGRDSTFGAGCYFGAAGGITVGDDVMAGQNIRFHAENHVMSDVSRPIREQGVTHRGITIGNDCWIGAGAVFLDGANVGKGCVVAANAVVTCGDWPAYSVLGGVPAKVLKSRMED